MSAAGGAAFDVTVAPLSGEGTVRLDVHAAGGIADAAGNGLAAGFTAGQVFSRVLVGNGTWVRSLSGGLWSDNANWRDGIEAGGAGNAANFTGLELLDDVVVQLDGPRTIGHLVFGDTDPASAAGWIVDDGGDPASVLTLVASARPPSPSIRWEPVAASSWPRPWRAPPA